MNSDDVKILRNDIRGIKEDITQLRNQIDKVLNDHENRIRVLEKNAVRGDTKRDHEERIRVLEEKTTRLMVYFSLGATALGMIEVIGIGIAAYLGAQ